MRTFAALAVMLSVVVAPLLATAQSAPASPRPPSLVVKHRDKHEALSVTRVAIDATVVGHLAETRMTLTFHNPYSRNLEGELFFPLPEGATITGYALDVGGVMVDGVAVTKQHARQVFEAEVRKGIDPGLAEWVGGNQFRTRIFPLPPGGTRTVMVRWVTGLVNTGAGTAYRLPLNFKKDIAELAVRVEVVEGETAPFVVEGGPKGLTFEKTRKSFIAEATVKNTRPDRDLTIRIPDVEKRAVAIQKGSDGKVYFAVHTPVAPTGVQKSLDPKRVGLIWDATGSRDGTDHTREIALVESYLQRVGSVTVDLTLVRNTAEKRRSFRFPAQRDELIRTLTDVAYDGGTTFAAFQEAAGGKVPDLYLVVSDGLANFGRAVLPTFRAPAFVLNSNAGASHHALEAIASSSGGAYFNLARLPDAEVLPQLGRTPFSFLGATASGAEVYPRAARPASSAHTIVGRLDGDRVTLDVRFGTAGKTEASRSFTIVRADATDGDVLRQRFAQGKVAELMAMPDENATAIAQVGLDHHVVTPQTSLLVLERLDQYVEHGVRPPSSLPKMQAQWDAAQVQRREAQATERQSRLENVLALWKERVAWWEKKYEYPEDFRFGKPSPKKSASRDRRDAPVPLAEEAGAAPTEREADSRAQPSAKKEKAKGADGASISIRAWDPQTPYLKALKGAPKARRLITYFNQRKEFGDSPAFYVDTAEFFFREKDKAMGMQVISNLAELELDNPALLRVLAHRLEQLDEFDLAIDVFEQVLAMRPDEPQSHRDLALVFARRADSGARTRRADYQRALELLAAVVMGEWQRFDQIELIALTELNNILPRAKKAGVKGNPVDERLIKALDMDVRIVMTWDADLTDMDLHVVEPSGEEAYYSHNRTTIGGMVSRDFTQGYGPEVYAVRRAMKGEYSIRTKYFGSSAAKLAGAVTLQVTIYTNYGRANQKRKTLTFRLTENKEMFTVGSITI